MACRISQLWPVITAKSRCSARHRSRPNRCGMARQPARMMAAASTRPAPALGGQGCQKKSDGPAGPDGPPRQSAGVASPGSHRHIAASPYPVPRGGRTSRGPGEHEVQCSAVQATHLPFSVVPVSGGVSLCPYHSTAHSLVLFRSLFFFLFILSCISSADDTDVQRPVASIAHGMCRACFFFFTTFGGRIASVAAWRCACFCCRS